MTIEITTHNTILFLAGCLFLFVVMLLLMLYDYYKNVYLKTFDLDTRIEILEDRITRLIEILRNQDGQSSR